MVPRLGWDSNLQSWWRWTFGNALSTVHLLITRRIYPKKGQNDGAKLDIHAPSRWRTRDPSGPELPSPEMPRLLWSTNFDHLWWILLIQELRKSESCTDGHVLFVWAEITWRESPTQHWDWTTGLGTVQQKLEVSTTFCFATCITSKSNLFV